MQYKIIVDKQPSSNPSNERKEYTIDIEELRVKGSVYDSINITPDRTYVTRRLALSEYGVLSELTTPVEEDLGDLNIELFEGDNYIYLYEMTGNRFCAEYVVKNDLTDDFATKNEMNSAITQTAQNIELSVNQKLTGYSTTKQMNAAIKLSANSITSTVSKTYATKTELISAKSEIKQTTDSITSTVSQKVGKTEISSTINQTAQGVKISAEKLDLSGLVTISNLQTAGKTTINGSNITTGTIDASKVNVTNLNASNIKSGTITGRAISGGTITGTQITNGNNFQVDANGNMICNNATFNGGNINLLGGNNENDAKFYVRQSSGSNIYTAITPKNIYIHGDGSDNARLYLSSGGSSKVYMYSTQNAGYLRVSSSNSDNFIELNGVSERVDILGTINAKGFNNTSLESIKKNIKLYEGNALKIVLHSKIYNYNLKTEKNSDKKHLGFVIGDNYRTPKEILSNDGNAIELYSCIGILWKAIQELYNKLEVS